MILISHRGNLAGKNPSRENTKEYIQEAISAGFNVEIDVWFIDGMFCVGHDKPKQVISRKFLTENKDKLWCHAKNIPALNKMIELNLHCFWHESDRVTLTSKGYVWAHVGRQPIEKSIAVMPEIAKEDTSQCIGVCSDEIIYYARAKL